MSKKKTRFPLISALTDINSRTLKSVITHQRSNLRDYVELNREYIQRISENPSVGGWLATQRDYNERLWNGYRLAVKVRTELLKTAVDETGQAMRDAMVRPKPATDTATETA